MRGTCNIVSLLNEGSLPGLIRQVCSPAYQSNVKLLGYNRVTVLPESSKTVYIFQLMNLQQTEGGLHKEGNTLSLGITSWRPDDADSAARLIL
jgi:hypothetical protein